MKYLYEFIGTFFLVFTVGMTVLTTGPAGLFAPVAIGSILATMIYAGGHISGGHYNPAVSLAVFVRGKLKSSDLGGYWVSQLVGGALAALLTLYLKGHPEVDIIEYDMLKLFVAELLFTFALCYVVLNVATAKATASNSYYGFAIGFTVVAGAYAVGTISSAAFNPAVALGVGLMNLVSWPAIGATIAANLVGGALAALVFKQAHPKE